MTLHDVVRFIHLLSIVLWVGSLVFFSFFAAPSIFKVLPREAAGDVVGDIFPKYWAVGYVSSVLALATLVMISLMEKNFPAVRVLILSVMTAVTFYSGLSVGTKARAIKAEMRAAEETSAKEELGKGFKKVHAISSALNVVIIVLGVALVFFTSRSMRL
ncbi:MAG TPA: DUF4149 domain-containing protein [Thermodesulfobacteriota bacterium]|nr:DUF4149 domain-containing protein [Thermodesulfobacteriota bacterium]